jgi:hypothetical protein
VERRERACDRAEIVAARPAADRARVKCDRHTCELEAIDERGQVTLPIRRRIEQDRTVRSRARGQKRAVVREFAARNPHHERIAHRVRHAIRRRADLFANFDGSRGGLGEDAIDQRIHGSTVHRPVE